jgi:hypothetical protein
MDILTPKIGTLQMCPKEKKMPSFLKMAVMIVIVI